MDENVKKLLSAIADGALLVDGSGGIVFANASLHRMLGYEGDDLAGERLEKLIPESERDAHARARVDFQREPEARRMGQRSGLLARKKDGSYTGIEVSLSPVEFDGEAFVLALVRQPPER